MQILDIMDSWTEDLESGGQIGIIYTYWFWKGFW